ncbi:Inner membrane transport protein YhjV [Citrobacter koseri]|uniref:Inner membrane transport protein YhjV n=1 Tax=Citrobacter koseri TaxID=545 RepID=A0A447UMF6_CITKO|nr:Inner membrane transport protein YhjV [Citrobacter koseri]
MQDNTLQLSNSKATTAAFSKKLPFTKYDFGWVLLCIGMAIGAGTVLMPVQIGLKGIWGLYHRVYYRLPRNLYRAGYLLKDVIRK